MNPAEPKNQKDQDEDNILADLPENSPERKLPIRTQLALIAALFVLLFSGGLLPIWWNQLQGQDQAANTSSPEITSEKIDVDPFADISLEASSIFVWDVSQNQVLYKHNPDEQMPLASLTKLMTVMVAHELLENNKIISISKEAIEQAGEGGLSSGEEFSFETLADLTLLTSSNDGAYALAASAGELLDKSAPASAFVKAMNVRAKELELSQTYFRNPTGLDIDETEAGAYGSARDISFLMSYILREYPEILESTTINNSNFYDLNGRYHEAENTNPAVNNIAGLIGSKTGYTTLAGGNLVIAFDAGINRPVIVSVLGSSYQGRFNDVLKLVEASRTALAKE